MSESTDKQLPDDEQLDEYLKGDSSVSRQYRQLHSAEVPVALDRLVLRQAEDAVQSPAGQVKAGRGRPAWVRWTAPLAVAASAVLVLSIVVETGMRDETLVMQAPQPTVQAQRERLENKAAEPSATGQAAGSSRFVPPAEVAAEPLMEEQLEIPATPQQATPAVPPPPKLDVPSPRSPPTIRPTTVPPPAAEERARKQSALADQVIQEEERSELAKSQPAEADRAASLPVYTDPEEWLEDIRQLRKEHKQTQADGEWQRFRAAFPDYEVAETDTAREAKK